MVSGGLENEGRGEPRGSSSRLRLAANTNIATNATGARGGGPSTNTPLPLLRGSVSGGATLMAPSPSPRSRSLFRSKSAAIAFTMHADSARLASRTARMLAERDRWPYSGHLLQDIVYEATWIDRGPASQNPKEADFPQAIASPSAGMLMVCLPPWGITQCGGGSGSSGLQPGG